MAKVDLDLVKMVLQRNDIDIKQIAEIIEEIQMEVESKIEEEKVPMAKKQFVIMVSDPNNELEGVDLVGWVAQIPEEESPYTAVDRVCQAVYDFNTSARGRRMNIKKVGEACENVPARFFKEQKVWIKTKEPVLLVRTDNKIPLDGAKSLQEAVA